MTGLTDEQIAYFVKLFDALEQQREDVQSGFKDGMKDLREALGKLFEKDDVNAEADGLRKAVRRMFDERTNPEKFAKSEAKADSADSYYLRLKNVQASDNAHMRVSREAA